MVKKTASRDRSFVTNLRLKCKATELDRTADLRGRIVVVEFDRFPDWEVCQFCGQDFKDGAKVGHAEDLSPQALLNIGIDCAAKLERFNQTGEVASSDREQAEHGTHLLRHLYGQLMLPGKSARATAMTVKKWFETHYDELPVTVKTAFDWVRRVGYPPSLQHATALIEHYQSECEVELNSVLRKDLRRLYQFYGTYLGLAPTVKRGALSGVIAQLQSAEADVRLKWSEALTKLMDGVAVSREQLTMQWGPLEFTYGAFKITAFMRALYAHNVMLETAPPVLRVAHVDQFDPLHQTAQVRLDPVLVDRWLERAVVRSDELREQERRAAERTARKAERERRKRIASLLAHPIRLDEHTLGTTRVVDGGFCLEITTADRIVLEVPIDNVTVAASLYLETKPDELHYSVDQMTEDCKRARLKPAPRLVESWHARAQQLFEEKKLLSSALLDRFLTEEVDRPGSAFLRLAFTPEVRRSKRWDKKDFEVLVHRAGAKSYHLSFDDSYRLDEGAVLVWVASRFHPGGSAYKVHRVYPRAKSDGTSELVYHLRVRGQLKPAEVPIKAFS